MGAAGGIITTWRRDIWSAGAPLIRRFSVTVLLTPLDSVGAPWWLTNVYGPTNRDVKPEFHQELRDLSIVCQGPWAICGDFNIIYQAADKNNARLHHGLMRQFRAVIDDLQHADVHLHGRMFT